MTGTVNDTESRVQGAETVLVPVRPANVDDHLQTGTGAPTGMSHDHGIRLGAAAEEETRGNGIVGRGTTDVEIAIETHRPVVEIAPAPQDHRLIVVAVDSMTDRTTDETITSETTRN